MIMLAGKSELEHNLVNRNYHELSFMRSHLFSSDHFITFLKNIIDIFCI